MARHGSHGVEHPRVPDPAGFDWWLTIACRRAPNASSAVWPVTSFAIVVVDPPEPAAHAAPAGSPSSIASRTSPVRSTETIGHPGRPDAV